MTATLIPVAPAPSPAPKAASVCKADTASESSTSSFAGELARAGGDREDASRSADNHGTTERAAHSHAHDKAHHDSSSNDSADGTATDPTATAAAAAVVLVATVPATGGTVATSGTASTTATDDAVGAVGATATSAAGAVSAAVAAGAGAPGPMAGSGAPTAGASAVINSALGSPGQPQSTVDHGKGAAVSAVATAGPQGLGERTAGTGTGTGAAGAGSVTPSVINSASGLPGQPQSTVDHGKGAAVSAVATAGPQGLGERTAQAGAAAARVINSASGSPGQPQPTVDQGQGAANAAGAAAAAAAAAGATGQQAGTHSGTSKRDGSASTTDGIGGTGSTGTGPDGTSAGAAFSLPSGPGTVSTTANPATTNAAASATTTVPIPDPQPALTSALARLHVGANGTQQLTVQLHPADLGAVNVTATINNGTLNVTVACADQAARAAVTAALPSLHHQLSTAGFTGVDVNFGGPSQQAPQQQADPRAAGGYPSDAGRDTALTGGVSATAATATATARLHASSAGLAGLDRLL